MLQLLKPGPDRGRFSEADLASEECVIVVEGRLARIADGPPPAQDDALEHLRPPVVRTQLGAPRLGGADEDGLEHGGECRVVGLDRVMERGDEEHERRKSLLTVDEHEFRTLPVPADGGEDRADEVHVAVVGVGDGAHVGEQLLAGADVPPVLALIHRDHDGQVGRQPRDGVDRSRVDVRGIASVPGHPPSLGRRAAAPFPRPRSRGPVRTPR